MAIRSGQYRKINVVSIKEGELVEFDPLNEVIKVHLIDDEERREKAPTVGYYAMFELVNGFRKAIFWSKDKMYHHAMKYSKGFASQKGYTFWEKDFDGMAHKTMIRQLISKWGILSIEMESAIESDYTYKDKDGNVGYVDEGINEDIDVDEVDAIDIDVQPTQTSEDIATF